jgi:hypothetical protein
VQAWPATCSALLVTLGFWYLDLGPRLLSVRASGLT